MADLMCSDWSYSAFSFLLFFWAVYIWISRAYTCRARRTGRTGRTRRPGVQGGQGGQEDLGGGQQVSQGASSLPPLSLLRMAGRRLARRVDRRVGLAQVQGGAPGGGAGLMPGGAGFKLII